jgi:hypothetical protein
LISLKHTLCSKCASTRCAGRRAIQPSKLLELALGRNFRQRGNFDSFPGVNLSLSWSAVPRCAQSQFCRDSSQCSVEGEPEPQHFLNFLPEPQGQGSLRPTFTDRSGSRRAKARPEDCARRSSTTSSSKRRSQDRRFSRPVQPRITHRPRHGQGLLPGLRPRDFRGLSLQDDAVLGEVRRRGKSMRPGVTVRMSGRP